MSEKYYSRLAVSLVLTRINKDGKKEILLQLRKNTGYMDNMYDFAFRNLCIFVLLLAKIVLCLNSYFSLYL